MTARSRGALRALLAVGAGLAAAACGGAEPGVADATPDALDGEITPIVPVETDGPITCMDLEPLPDVPDDAEPACATDADCADAPGPVPPCRRPVCLLPEGTCSLAVVADGTPCQDGDPCTVGDACEAGACVPGAGTLACDDQNPCTDDACVPGAGCASTPNDAPCDDGNPCTVDDVCAGGVCVPGPGMCDCETTDDCKIYEDGNACNGTLVCDTTSLPYACVVDPATAVTCPPPAAPCTVAACVPATGACEEGPAPDDTPCDDGEPCTEGDRCAAGGCAGLALPDGAACDDGDPCTAPDACLAGACAGGLQNPCACGPGMVLAGAVCLDQYEASRPDATATGVGSDTGQATSRRGVLPWFPVERAQAAAACAAAGKRLCTAGELLAACEGPAGTAYVYGDAYVADTCNGIDAFCDCAHPNCAGLATCPYPHCRVQSPQGVPGLGCGAAFHVTPTGAFPGCVNAWGAYDLNGNVWELVDVGTSESWYRGGAYNCADSELLHRCDGLWQGITAKGFRCCMDPTP